MAGRSEQGAVAIGLQPTRRRMGCGSPGSLQIPADPAILRFWWHFDPSLEFHVVPANLGYTNSLVQLQSVLYPGTPIPMHLPRTLTVHHLRESTPVIRLADCRLAQDLDYLLF